MRNIETLAAQPDVLEVLARSLAPSIYGHQTIKLGLVLQLLGGRCAAAPAPPRPRHGPGRPVTAAQRPASRARRLGQQGGMPAGTLHQGARAASV